MSQPLINITRKQAYIFAVFLVLYEFLTYIANDMIMPGMIKVAQSFNAPESVIASSLTVYILGGASLQLFLGPLSDRFGRRPVMLSGALLFFVFTLFTAVSLSINQFLLARFFQGMGLCFIGVIGYATLQEIFAEMDAVRLISIMANVSILAPLLGPILGVVFIHYYSWRIIFLIIAVFALVALWGLWRFMPESVGQIKRDGGQIKVEPLSLGVILSNYKTLLLTRPFMLGTIGYGLLALPCVAWIALSPVILVLDAKLSMIQYGLWQLPLFGMFILGSVFLQRLTHVYSIRTLSWIGILTSMTGLITMMAMVVLMGDGYTSLLPGLIIYFFGYGIASSPLNRFILFSTHISKGTASALISMLTMTIQGLGIELINLIYVSQYNYALGVSCGAIGLISMIFFVGSFLNSQSKIV